MEFLLPWSDIDAYLQKDPVLIWDIEEVDVFESSTYALQFYKG